MKPSRLWGGLAVAMLAALTLAESAMAQFSVAVMPSYTQNRAYANAALGESITVWGRAWGAANGSTYSYTIDFGDGSPVVNGTATQNGTIAGNRYMAADHTYSSAGSKTITLTVTNGGTTISKSSD